MLELDENIVRLRAYEIWEADGRPEGRETQHWERALSDVTSTFPRPARAKGRPRKPETAAKPRRKALKAAS